MIGRVEGKGHLESLRIPPVVSQRQPAKIQHVGANEPEIVALLHLGAQLDGEALLQSKDVALLVVALVVLRLPGGLLEILFRAERQLSAGFNDFRHPQEPFSKMETLALLQVDHPALPATLKDLSLLAMPDGDFVHLQFRQQLHGGLQLLCLPLSQLLPIPFLFIREFLHLNKDFVLLAQQGFDSWGQKNPLIDISHDFFIRHLFTGSISQYFLQ